MQFVTILTVRSTNALSFGAFTRQGMIAVLSCSTRLLLCFVEHYLALPVRDDTGFQIVALYNARYAAVKVESVDIRLDPVTLIHGEECFDVGVPAVWKYCD